MEDKGLVNLGVSPELAKRMGFSCGTVAAAGSTYADAARATKICLVTGADATKGVILPALDPGEFCVLRNVANAVLKVYTNLSTETIYVAASASAVNGQSTGVQIAAYYTLVIFKVSATEMIALELVGA